ncbi:ABC transporter permease [Halorientalis brevis]|uniref:ABC transporter permease n=1 Tax=Halorientalis brevis TaxID=1126241 RepID=A0ABD6C9S2_9EURY|nr:ABC transporter permease subunit [Halorientalis brevis]
MSVLTVAKQDFKSARRSRALWTAATLFTLLAALIAFGTQGYRLPPAEQVQNLFRTLGMVLGILLPIIALVASYMSIAGQRESGGIKFLLGFPNTRRDVFLGKLLSRLALVSSGLVLVFVAATSVAVTRHGTLPIGTVLGLFAVSLLYGAVFVCVAVALSAAIGSRSRAIGAAVGSYFVLVVLYVVPTIRIGTLVQWVHHTMLGMETNPDLYNAVTYTSPYIAFRKAQNLVFPEAFQRQVFMRASEDTATDLPVYLSDEFALLVFAAWLVVPLVVGYLRFDRTDLE